MLHEVFDDLLEQTCLVSVLVACREDVLNKSWVANIEVRFAKYARHDNLVVFRLEAIFFVDVVNHPNYC